MSISAVPGQVEKPADLKKSEKSSPSAREALRWQSEINAAIKYQEKYLKRCNKIIEKYRTEQKGSRAEGGEKRQFNVLWSMVNTLQPNLFMGMPRPYVSRRYRDKDPVARTASMILERCLVYANDSDEMHDAFSSAVDDNILAARGTVWTRYSPEFDLRESETKTYYKDGDDLPDDDAEGVEYGEDEKGKYYTQPYEELSNEECETDHVQLANFLHPAASSWKQVPWIAKRVLMTRTELVKRFGKKVGNMVPLGYKADGTRKDGRSLSPDEGDGIYTCATVYEVWQKEHRCVYWVCLECDYLLDKKDDPLGLTKFYPIPRPLYGTLTNNSLIPIPDYRYYEHISMELDDITQRIALLTQSLRVVGFYDSNLGESISRLTTETEENSMIPLENFQSITEGGGLKGAVEFLPIDQIMTVLAKLYEARTQLIQELYEITGMSDIIRGTSDPRETAAAQKLKGSYASKRLQRRQHAVARFAREHLEIQAEIICMHYSDETIKRISGADQLVLDANGQFDEQLFAAAMELLRNNPLRHFRIKIDNETLAGDEMQENREQGMAFLQSISQLLGTAIPAAAENPPLKKVAKELVLFGMRLFPVARSVESSLEAALEEMANAPPPPPEQAAPQKGMTGEQEFQIAMKQLELEGQRIAIEKEKLAQARWKEGWEVYIKSKDASTKPKLQDKQIEMTHDAAMAAVAQRDRSDKHKVQADLTKAATQADQAAVDSERRHGLEVQREENRRHEAGAEFERDTHEKAIGIAERQSDRDHQEEESQRDRDENRRKADLDRKAKSKEPA